MSFINIFMPNLQMMFIWMYYIRLLKKIAVSLFHSLTPQTEPPADVGHGVPGEVAHPLNDLCHQRGAVLLGALFTYRSQTHHT